MNAKTFRKLTDILAFWGKVFTKLHIFVLSVLIFKMKDKLVLHYIEKKYGNFIDALLKRNLETKKSETPIWVCWLQGEENAPELVKKCIASIRANANGHKVNVITEDNLSEFIQIPDYIIRNVAENKLSRTSYSDIIRSFLLAEYGGIWIDATFFITQMLPQPYFNSVVFSAAKQPEPKNRRAVCISEYRWTGSFIGCNICNYSLFTFLKDFFVEYEKNEIVFIDYLLIDYLIFIAFSRSRKIHDDITAIPDNNIDFGWLFHAMNDYYDEQKAKEMFFGETFCYKLSYKIGWKSSKKDKKTFYGAFLDGFAFLPDSGGRM